MIKNNCKIYLALLIALSALHTGCQKYEDAPLNIQTEDLIYDQMDVNAFFAEQVLNDLYTYLPNGFNRINKAFLDAATDDAVSSQLVNNQIEILSKGRQSPSNTVDDAWIESYTAIRKANLFLSKIDKVPTTDQTKVYWKAEARFIRAMSYFEMIRRYGGVPLIGNKILNFTDDFNIPRNSFAECVQYIVTELDDIKDKLRKAPVTDVDLGRITEGAALALKSRLLLYNASPLNNPANDASKWQSAYDAAKEVMNLNVYKLVAATGATAGTDAFRNIFITRKNDEVILAYQRALNQTIERDNAPVGYKTPNSSAGLTSPTQEFVDAFPTNTGLPINKTLAAYKANPYLNRDQRLEATIFYNGSKWLNRAVETFEGGLDKPNRTGQTQTKTGYYLKKFIADNANSTAYSAESHNFIIFRYAEILLNLAEAANELGKNAEALAQLRELRKRAGIAQNTVPVTPGQTYGLKDNLTKDELKTAIELERRIELAFEEHRFWDMRRRKLAETSFNKMLHGMQIIKTGNILNYTETDVEPIRFLAPKMYLYPIPYSETLKNTALTQNPGWN